MSARHTAETFWRLVDKTGECWIWTGRRIEGGYGQVRWQGARVVAHRVAWELAHGQPVPCGLMICHHCDNRLCVRPGHLFLGTAAENSADMVSKGRQRAGEDNAGAKLSRTQAQDTVDRCAAGEQQQAIARRFGVHPSTVSAIVAGRKWADLDRAEVARRRGVRPAQVRP